MPLASARSAATGAAALDFEVHDRWEGVVEEIHDTFFIAKLVNLRSDVEATAEFVIDDVSAGDRELLRLGALFYWYVGYERLRPGWHRKVAYLWFRRGNPDAAAVDPPVAWYRSDSADGG